MLTETRVKLLIRLTIGISDGLSMLIPHNCFPICIPCNLLPSANFPWTKSIKHKPNSTSQNKPSKLNI